MDGYDNPRSHGFHGFFSVLVPEFFVFRAHSTNTEIADVGLEAVEFAGDVVGACEDHDASAWMRDMEVRMRDEDSI
jgi:hypothetical protein